MSDPLRDREVAAVRAFRATGDRKHLDVLRMDGLPRLVLALTMERALSDPEARPYTDEITVWLGEDAAAQ